MATKKLVAQFLLDAGGARQELDALRAAEEAFSVAGGNLATSLSNGMEQFEQSVNKAFQRLQDGGKVSEAAISALISKLAAMKAAAEASGKPIPPEFEKALATAEKQLTALTGAMETSKKRTEEMRGEFVKSETSLKDLAREASASGDKIGASLLHAENSAREFDQAIEEGSPRVASNLVRLIITTQNLREQIEATQRAGGVVTPEQLAQLDRYEKKVIEAKGKVRELTDELQEQKTELGEGGERWTGLTNAINKALGPLGAVQARIGLVAAALREGWQAGQGLNKMFHTDMSLWTELTESWGKKVGLVLKDIADTAVAAGGVIAAVFTPGQGWVENIEKAFGAYKAAVKDTVDTVTDLDKALQKEKEARAATLAAQEANKKKVEEETAAKEKLVKATKEVAAAVEEEKTAKEAAAIVETASIEAVDARTESVRRQIEAIDILLQAMEAERGATELQTELNQFAGASADYLRMKREQLVKEAGPQLAVWKAETQAVAEQEDVFAKLNAIVEREIASVKTLKISSGELDITFAGVKLSAGEAADTIRRLGQEFETANESARRFKETMDSANASVRAAAGSDA